MPEVQQALARLTAQEKIQPRIWLALRASAAFMAPLLLAASGIISPFVAVVASFSAHSITMQDVRGHYGLRLRILLFQALIVTGAVGLGAAAGHGQVFAILAAALIAMGAGFLRHMLPEYGPGMAAASAMLFFTTLAAPHAIGPTLGLWLVLASVLGSLWGTLLVVMAWPIAPQHPLRAALGESWQALADFCDAMEARPVTELAQRHQEMAARELALDQIQARTQKVLDGAGHPRQRPLLPAFILLNRRAGGMANQLSALDRLLVAEGADPGVEEAFHTLLHALSNTSKSISMALVSRRRDQTERTALRLARASSLLAVLRTRLEGRLQAPASDHAVDLLRSLDGFLMDLPPILRSTLATRPRRRCPPWNWRTCMSLPPVPWSAPSISTTAWAGTSSASASGCQWPWPSAPPSSSPSTYPTVSGSPSALWWCFSRTLAPPGTEPSTGPSARSWEDWRSAPWSGCSFPPGAC